MNQFNIKLNEALNEAEQIPLNSQTAYNDLIQLNKTMIAKYGGLSEFWENGTAEELRTWERLNDAANDQEDTGAQAPKSQEADFMDSEFRMSFQIMQSYLNSIKYDIKSGKDAAHVIDRAIQLIKHEMIELEYKAIGRD